MVPRQKWSSVVLLTGYQSELWIRDGWNTASFSSLSFFLTSPSRSFSAHQVYLSYIHPQTRDRNSTYDVEAKFRAVYVIQNLNQYSLDDIVSVSELFYSGLPFKFVHTGDEV